MEPGLNELEQINQYAVKPLEAGEVFTFSVLLCDNEIDRDHERFDIPALKRLGELFLGKTGIFDHDMKAGHQTARIYHTAVEADASRATQAGEPYHKLMAKAYMLRCEKNKDLISEIEAGIKKEVSVGCSVERVVCSACGCDLGQKQCGHRPGDMRDGKSIHKILQNPTDAYEWSFVAVPAQRGAGVTKNKRYGQGWQEAIDVKPNSFAAEAKAYIAELEALAQAGEAYRKSLLGDIIRYGFFGDVGLDDGILEGIGRKLDIGELQALHKALQPKNPAKLQLGSSRPLNGENENNDYTI